MHRIATRSQQVASRPGVLSKPVMPWRARTDAGLSLMALALVATVVISCVSITSEAAVPGSPHAAVQAAVPSPTSRPVEARIDPDPTDSSNATDATDSPRTQALERQLTDS